MAENETTTNVPNARDTIETLQEISKILNTGLDSETLTVCLRLCESGVNPEALSLIIKELRRETAVMQSAENVAQSSS